MKKLLFFLSIFLISISLFASDEYSVAFGWRINSQVEHTHCFLIEGETDKFSFTFMENGGEYVSLDTVYKDDFSSMFFWNTGATINYFSLGAGSLLFKGSVNGRYGTENVNLVFGLGVQLGALKYRYLDSILFSLSPLFNLSINLRAEDNSFSFGMVMDMKYERQFKAVETFFLMARKEISSRFAMSLELWGRGAEYLMDPWLSFQGYGALMKFTIKGDS